MLSLPVFHAFAHPIREFMKLKFVGKKKLCACGYRTVKHRRGILMSNPFNSQSMKNGSQQKALHVIGQVQMNCFVTHIHLFLRDVSLEAAETE